MADPKNPDRGAQVPNDRNQKGKQSNSNPFGAPPPVPVTSHNKHDEYVAWAKKQGIAQSVANDIWYWSHHTPNVDPYLWSSVLLRESGAKHLTDNGQLVSSGQAVGIGQVATSWIGQPIPWDPKHKFTADNDPRTGIGNYGVNLRFSAYLWGNAVAKYGWKNAYIDGYNPNDPKKDKAWQDIAKTYGTRPAGNPPIGSPSEGPADTSTQQQTGTSVYPTFKDPYVTGVNKKGKLVTTNDPNKAIQFNGLPVKRSDFISIQSQITSIFVSFTGMRPSTRQTANFITKNWNKYTLEDLLSRSKNFKNSPIYKEYVGNWENDSTIKNLIPKGGRIDPELARQAIVNGWTSDTVANKLRKTQGYLKSEEFAGTVASMLNIHTSIMGEPDAKGMIGIKDAALAGWTADQYANWLRSQPGYSRSPEYQTKALTILQSLGLITGTRPILAPGVTPGPGAAPVASPPLPTDNRVAGKPVETAPTDLGATLG